MDATLNREHVGVGLIAPEHLGEVWERVAPWIRQAFDACPRLRPSLAAARSRLRRRRWGLLVGAIGDRLVTAVVLEFVELRGERILAVVAAGGERGETLRYTGPVLWRAIQFIARGLGADSIRVTGRLGWLRWIRGRGKVREVCVDYEVRG